MGRVPPSRNGNNRLMKADPKKVSAAMASLMASMGLANANPSPQGGDDKNGDGAAGAAESTATSSSSSSPSQPPGPPVAASRERVSLKLQSRHFPPIMHTWSGGGSSLNGNARLPLEYMIPEQKMKSAGGSGDAPMVGAIVKGSAENVYATSKMPTPAQEALEQASKDCEYRLAALKEVDMKSKRERERKRGFGYVVKSSIVFIDCSSFSSAFLFVFDEKFEYHSHHNHYFL